jgi:P4 family phage/plasmid primase-like protien
VSDIRGAPRSAWLQFDLELGLGAHLLPVVPIDNATPTPHSKVAKFGKIPSLYDSQGLAYGISKWQSRPISSADLARWSSDGRYSMCVRTGSGSGLYALDVDVPDETGAARVTDLFHARVGSLCNERYRNNSGKRLLAFRIAGSPGLTKRSFRCEGGIVEFLADGQQFVAAGPHPSGAQYEWRGGLPDQFTEVTAEEFEAAWTALVDKFAIEPERKHAASGEEPGSDVERLTDISPADYAELVKILQYPPLVAAADLNDTWSEVGYALLTLDGGLTLWTDFSQRVDAARGSERRHSAVEWWAGHIDSVTRTDWRHIFTMAKRLGWGSVADADAFKPVAPSNAPEVSLFDDPPSANVGEVPPALRLTTDQANARRLEAAYGKRMVCVAGSFYSWEGTHWERDDGAADRFAMQLSALVNAEAVAAHDIAKVSEERLTAEIGEWFTANLQRHRDSKRKGNGGANELLRDPRTKAFMNQLLTAEELSSWTKQCEMGHVQDAAIKLLRKALTLDADQLDRDHFALNCTNGTVDLRTGTIRAHDPGDYITRCVPVAYDPAASAPRFEQFLVEIMGDESTVKFLQRWFGYCCTGDVREQVFAIHIGPGGNGKSTLMDTVANILGAYVGTAAPGLLADSGKMDRHPTEIADLQGRRLVTAHESNDTAVLREGFIKQATGGDSLKGRRLYQDLFEFRPTHKLQLFTNHKPLVKGTDRAIWRRILLIWYAVSFGTAEEVARREAMRVKDTTLPGALRAEHPGILAWMVRGAVEWYRDGLRPPDTVLEAVETYRREQDRATQFVNDRCIIEEGAWCGFPDMYEAYIIWCKRNGYQCLGKSRFISELERVVPNFRKAERKLASDGARRSVYGAYGARLDPNDDSTLSFAPTGVEGLL